MEYTMLKLPVVLAFATLPIVGFQVGTGGAETLDYLKNRGSMGYALMNYEPAQTSCATADVRTPVDDLNQIRKIFHPAVTDLANALGVSRQAIYDWQAGKPIAAENASRLSDLARAADIFALEGLTSTAQLLRRPISSGKNFYTIVRDGGSAESAARSLIEIVRRETQQHQKLAARLAGRPLPSRDAYEDIGIPVFEEDV
jgi:DNA-binding transcriptional regulator YiaG